jgi:hypothetical protein
MKIEKSSYNEDNDQDEYGRLGRETAERFSEVTGRCIDAYNA